jgi:hypothetical protein
MDPAADPAWGFFIVILCLGIWICDCSINDFFLPFPMVHSIDEEQL